MVESLAISTRNFGGCLASAHFIAYFVDGVDEALAANLREFGVELTVVERYAPKHPTTDKLRMFQDFAARRGTQHLVVLDCDTVVVDDFVDQVSSLAVRGMPAGYSPMTSTRWATLLTSLNLAPAASPTVMLRTGEEVQVPYLNSGVLLVPAQHTEALAAAWTGYVDEFVTSPTRVWRSRGPATSWTRSHSRARCARSRSRSSRWGRG